MRKLVMMNRISLDGYFAGANGEIDWFVRDDGVDRAVHEMIDADMMLCGRVTYQELEAFWPAAAHDPHLPETVRAMADEVNSMTKVVFSKTLKQVTWENSVLMSGNLLEEIKQLKQADGADIMMIGSGTLVQPLTDAGLIDDYVVILTPIILGAGKPLFKRVQTRSLALVETRRFDSGNVILHYRPYRAP